MYTKTVVRIIASLVLGLMLGCSSAPPRSPLPEELGNMAQVPGMSAVRFWGDERRENYWERRIEELETAGLGEYRGIANQPHDYLAVSGGGVNTPGRKWRRPPEGGPGKPQ